MIYLVAVHRQITAVYLIWQDQLYIISATIIRIILVFRLLIVLISTMDIKLTSNAPIATRFHNVIRIVNS